MSSCTMYFLAMIIIMSLLFMKLPVWLIFFITFAILTILIGGINSFTNTLISTTIDPSTWDLVIVMYLIATLVSLYRNTGLVKELGDKLVLAIKKPRIILMLVPAVLGLLPVPGGALMSAPIVDKVGEHLGLSPNKKLFINVWFRHVIFVVYPLSSVLVLVSALTNTSIWYLIIHQIPVLFIMIIIGYLIGFTHTHNTEHSIDTAKNRSHITELFRAFSPVIASIVIALSLSILIDNLTCLRRLSMIIGVSTGIVLLVHITRTELGSFLKTLISRSVWELSLIGYTAMLLRKTFIQLDPGCIFGFTSYLDPLVLVIIILVFFSLVTGVNTTSIALSIPILENVVKITPTIASLVFISAYLSYIGSPLHLCLLYSAQYYGVKLSTSYKYLAPAVILSLALSIMIYLFIYNVTY